MSKVVSGRDLAAKVRNLNVLHNKDPGQPGFLILATWRPNLRRHFLGRQPIQYRVVVTDHQGGVFCVTRWGQPREVMDDLSTKDWRAVMHCARGAEKKRFVTENEVQN